MMDKTGLRPYLEKRVTVTAYFDRISTAYSASRSFTNCMLLDLTVTVDGKTFDGGGHRWLQQAERLCGFDLQPGDKIRFTARLYRYEKRNPDGGREEQFGIGSPDPESLEMLNRKLRLAEYQEDDEPMPPPMPPAPVDVAPVPPADPIALIGKLKALTKDAGGWDKLLALIDVIKP